MKDIKDQIIYLLQLKRIKDGFLVLIHCVKLILIQIEWLLKNIFMMRINQNISHIEILRK